MTELSGETCTIPPYAVGPYGRVACLPEVRRVLDEKRLLEESGFDEMPRRIPPDQVELALEMNPMAVVLDQLQERMTTDEAHTYVMEKRENIGWEEGSRFRIVELIHAGGVDEVLEHIAQELGDPVA